MIPGLFFVQQPIVQFMLQPPAALQQPAMQPQAMQPQAAPRQSGRLRDKRSRDDEVAGAPAASHARMAFPELSSRLPTEAQLPLQQVYLAPNHNPVFAMAPHVPEPLVPQRFPCPQCVKAFSKSCHLKQHVETKHEGLRVTCSFAGCGSTFSTSSNRIKHIKRAHKGKQVLGAPGRASSYE